MIDSLPTELLCLIFLQAVYDPFDNKDSDGSSTTPLRLGAICKEWRTTVWNCTDLWTSLKLTLCPDDGIADGQIILLRDWLSRSGNLPLSIHLDSIIHDTPLTQVIQMLDQCSDRWQRLVLRVPTGSFPLFSQPRRLPLLQTVSVHPLRDIFASNPTFDLHDTPQLRSVRLQCGITGFQTFNFQWELLYHADITHANLNACISLLLRCNRLVCVTFNAIFRNPLAATPFSSEPIVLPRLKELRLTDVGLPQIQTLMGKIITPNLTTLQFQSQLLTFPSEDVISLIQRSDCQLVHLSLKGMSLRLILILPHLPSLVTLTVWTHLLNNVDEHPMSPSLLTDKVLTLLDARSPNPCLPRLEALDYIGKLSFSWVALITVMESRCPSLAPPDSTIINPPLDIQANPIKPLRRLTLKFVRSAESDEWKEGLDACKERVEMLRRAGMEIGITFL